MIFRIIVEQYRKFKFVNWVQFCHKIPKPEI